MIRSLRSKVAKLEEEIAVLSLPPKQICLAQPKFPLTRGVIDLWWRQATLEDRKLLLDLLLRKN